MHTPPSNHTSSTYALLLDEGTRLLEAACVETPRLDAEVLLRFLAGMDRTQLFLRLPELAPPDLLAPYRQVLRRRVSGDPVAYIIGEREFMGLIFHVTEDVLIPRPETELLVEWALERISDPGRMRTCVDIGTGSGAIAVSVSVHGAAPVRMIATDVSESAISIATGNAASLIPEHRRETITFRKGSLLDPIAETGVNLVVANLPYLTPAQIGEQPSLKSEPRIALDGGSDGLDLIRALVAELPRVLAPDGAIGLEIDPAQERQVLAMLGTVFPGRPARTIHDLAGLARHVVID